MSYDRFTWFGKSSDDLSREELLAVIRYLSRQLDEYRAPAAIRASAIGRVEMLKRGAA